MLSLPVDLLHIELLRSGTFVEGNTFWEANKEDVQAYVVFLNEDFETIPEGFISGGDILKIEEGFFEQARKKVPSQKRVSFEDILKKHQFKGKVGQSFAFTDLWDDKLVTIVFVGLGKYVVGSGSHSWGVTHPSKCPNEIEKLRRAVGAAILKLKSLKVETAVMQMPHKDRFKGVDSEIEISEIIKQVVITSYMANYEFTTFKSKEETDEEGNALKDVELKIFLSTVEGRAFYEDEEAVFQKTLEQAEIVGKAVNKSRLLCDMPPNIANPSYVGEHAKKLATDTPGLKCAILGKDRAEELGMGGFLAVDAGSDQDGKIVILEYNCEEENAPTIALVGKGVTFDSGGISLKPAAHMSGMKYDMSGAAAVISSVEAIAHLKPAVNVVGIAPLVENMPSGKATRQDDIITFMNGKTAEIINTDAEGRLILADALCYAEEFYKPDVIIDIATLTGACSYALGHFYTGLMSNSPEVVELIKRAGDRSGDKVWELPFDNDYRAAIKSKFADISNCGSSSYKAGTITAGFFLSNFVKTSPWAHLDIAGTADGVPGVNYLKKGSTGVGVRLFVDFILNYKK